MAEKELKKLFKNARKALLSHAVPVAPIYEREQAILRARKKAQTEISLDSLTATAVFAMMTHRCARREAKQKVIR